MEGDLERQDRGAGGQGEQKGGERTPEPSLWVMIVLLVVTTAFVTVTAECLVESIDRLTMDGKISKEFTGLILLPIVTNGPEHIGMIIAPRKGEGEGGERGGELDLSVVGGALVGFLLLGYSTCDSPPLANYAVCYPVHHHSWMDPRQTDYHALRPI